MKHIKTVDLMREVGMHPGSAKKTLDRYGIPMQRAGGQSNSPYVVTEENAEIFRQAVKQKIHLDASTELPPDTHGSGVYALRVWGPTGERVKVGWSLRIGERLATHRCIVPDLEVLGIWPTGKPWMEDVALAVARKKAAEVSAEVFETDDVAGLVAEIDLVIDKIT